MAAGCKNPNAVNYSPTANPEDYSCVYLFKNQDNCHWFKDVLPEDNKDKSFTMSYSVKSGSWVFFHDYFPDMYFHTREQLFNAKNSSIWKHHGGQPGWFHQEMVEPNVAKSFFIDVVFQNDKNLILETINWMTDFLSGQTDQPFQTLTHITVWNSHQHSTRVPLSKLQPFKSQTARNTKGEWIFTDFRNLLIDKGVEFLQDIFQDYLVVDAQTDPTMNWYRKELLTDKWFCVRFEFDNTSNVQLVLHDTTVQAIKSDR